MLLPLCLLALCLQRSDCWKEYLDYDRSLKKRVNCQCRIDFIEKCIQADIIPRFLKFRIPENGCFEPRVVHNFQRNLLKAELAKARKQKETHVNVIETKRTLLRNKVQPKFIHSIIFHTRNSVNQTKHDVQNTHSKKLSALSKEQQRPLFDVHDTIKICDNDIKPPQYVIDTLALGPRNAVLDEFNQKETLAQIDALLYNCKKDKVADEIMNDINVATLKYIKSCSKQKCPRNLLLTKRYLKEHDILAVPFDKGVGICLMKRDTYNSKMDDILKLDQFEKLTNPRCNSRDFTLKEEERINTELENLNEHGQISDELLLQLKSKGGQPARLYGTAKVHKTVIPLRPVLSMPGSPYYNTAQTVTKWLSVVPESKTQCTSKKVADQLKDITLDDDEVLVSFDVVSLYTNVPVEEAIQEAADRLYSGEFETPPITKDTFIKLITLASTNVVMSTHEGYYVQKEGLAMGSPPAPLLANIWLAKRELEIKGDAKLFERYMDDVIRSIRQSEIEEILRHINLIHPNLKFTIEMEVNGDISFLDMLLMRRGRKLFSTWYCKPTDTGLVMNFHALAPRRYKRSVVSGFVHRIYRACSTWQYVCDSIDKAKAVLEKNQYPPLFYEPIIAETVNKLRESTKPTKNPATNSTDAQQKHRMLLQYRGQPTDQFVKQLKKCGAPGQVILTLRKLKTYLPSLKAPTPMLLKSNVIYQITCPRCETCYVGKTSRHTGTRFGEHRTKKKEPVFKHVKGCGGNANSLTDKDIKILASVTKGAFHLAIMEALFIRELRPGMNVRDEFRDHELTIKF